MIGDVDARGLLPSARDVVSPRFAALLCYGVLEGAIEDLTAGWWAWRGCRRCDLRSFLYKY